VHIKPLFQTYPEWYPQCNFLHCRHHRATPRRRISAWNEVQKEFSLDSAPTIVFQPCSTSSTHSVESAQGDTGLAEKVHLFLYATGSVTTNWHLSSSVRHIQVADRLDDMYVRCKVNPPG